MQGKQSSEFWNAVLFLHKLKLKLEAIEREYSNLLSMKREYLNSVKQIHAPKVLPFPPSFKQFKFFLIVNIYITAN